MGSDNEQTQIKFVKSERTGRLIGFVSRQGKTHQLKGVREDSIFGKKICVLSYELRDVIIPNRLYATELKAMHNGKGYVVVSAVPVFFSAVVETKVIQGKVYEVTVSFGNKIIYFNPLYGKSSSSATIGGVLKVLRGRKEIENKREVILEFITQANLLLEILDLEDLNASPK